MERITLISEAANTERPSEVTDFLYIGGALAAKSMYTLKQIGITHVLCLCSNEIGQAEFQNPSLFSYKNFSVSIPSTFQILPSAFKIGNPILAGPSVPVLVSYCQVTGVIFLWSCGGKLHQEDL